MDNPKTQEPLELEVANFGPIVEAKIQLRPPTVFVGPSNTGKSYLAILIYALHSFVRMKLESLWLERFPNQNTARRVVDAILEWKGDASANEMAGNGSVLPDLVRRETSWTIDASGREFAIELVRCFGVERTSALIRHAAKNGANVFLRKHSENNPDVVEHHLTLDKSMAKFTISVPKHLLISTEDMKSISRKFQRYGIPSSIEFIDFENRADLFEYYGLLLDILNDYTFPQIFGNHLCQLGFYMPADRTGVMHVHRMIVSSIIGNAPMTGLRPDTTRPMLSGVLADFLRRLIEIDRPQEPWSESPSKRVQDLGKQIEEEILRGKVNLTRSEMLNHPHFTYQPSGWRASLPLMNTSSMVSELAPVVLYLRYLVCPGQTLIIEEPESHLHPAMQVEFVRQLAALVQAGVRVVVTTHSEWVMEELANIVQRSGLSEAERKTTPHGNIALSPDQVGVWLFKPKRRPKGSVVSEIALDDSGLYPSGYDEIAYALHNDWAEISSLRGKSE